MRPATVDAHMHVLLRVRALQALVLGGSGTAREDIAATLPDPLLLEPGNAHGQEDQADGARAGSQRQSRGSLMLRAQRVQEQLEAFVKHEDAQTISDFLAHYDRDAPYLTPSFVLSGFLPEAETTTSKSATDASSQEAPGAASSGTPISQESQLSMLLELESSWRTLAAQLEEAAALEQRGVLHVFPPAALSISPNDGGADGKGPRAPAVRSADAQKAIADMDAKLAAFTSQEQAELLREQQALEKRLAAFLDSYSSYVDSMSQIFVRWDDALCDMERTVSRLEVQQQRQQAAA